MQRASWFIHASRMLIASMLALPVADFDNTDFYFFFFILIIAFIQKELKSTRAMYTISNGMETQQKKPPTHTKPIIQREKTASPTQTNKAETKKAKTEWAKATPSPWRATSFQFKRIESKEKPLKRGRTEAHEATRNLALSITTCTEEDVASKHFTFLSFQRDQMIARKRSSTSFYSYLNPPRISKPKNALRSSPTLPTDNQTTEGKSPTSLEPYRISIERRSADSSAWSIKNKH